MKLPLKASVLLLCKILFPFVYKLGIFVAFFFNSFFFLLGSLNAEEAVKDAVTD